MVGLRLMDYEYDMFEKLCIISMFYGYMIMLSKRNVLAKLKSMIYEILKSYK